MTKVPLSKLLEPKAFTQLFLATQLLAEMLHHKGWNPDLREFENLYVPDDHPKRNQQAFHESEAMHRLLLGGNQSGKSRAAAEEIKKHALSEKLIIWVVSAQYTNLENGVYRHLIEQIPPWEIVEEGQKITHTENLRSFLRLRNGTIISFKSGSGGKAARRKAASAEIDMLFIDEEVDDDMYKELQRRLLARGGRCVYTLTAVESVQWVLDLEDRADAGDNNVEKFTLSSLQAADVGHIDKDVLLDNIASATEEEIDVRVHGGTLRNQGLIYSNWDASLHICEPFDIPKEWTRYVGIDPGWQTFAVVWIAVAPNGRHYLYRELYEGAANIDVVADAIYQAEGWGLNPTWDSTQPYPSKWVFLDTTERITQRYIDPAEFGTNPGGGLKVGGMLASHHGITGAPAINDRNVGIQMCQQRLAMHLDGLPRTQVFSDMKNWLKERNGYRRRVSQGGSRWTNDPKPNPVQKRDHLMDAWRYVVASGAEGERGAAPIHAAYEEGMLIIPAGVSDVGRARMEAANRRLEQQLKGRRLAESTYGMGTHF